MPDGWSLLHEVVQKMTATDQLALSTTPSGGAPSGEGGNRLVDDGDSAADPEDLPESVAVLTPR